MIGLVSRSTWPWQRLDMSLYVVLKFACLSLPQSLKAHHIDVLDAVWLLEASLKALATSQIDVCGQEATCSIQIGYCWGQDDCGWCKLNSL